MAILTDAELLAMSLAVEALNGESTTARDAARHAASARVLASVKKRYAVASSWTVSGVTASDAPYELKDAAAAIAAFTLLAHRGVNDRDPTYVIVKDRYAAAAKFLVDLSIGEDVELVDVEMTKGAPLVKSGRAPRWNRDALLGYSLPCPTTGIDLGDGES